MKYLRSPLYALSTILLYLGLPSLGWGWDDLAGFFSQGPRLAYGLVVLAFGLAVGWQAIDAPEGIRGGSGEKEKFVFRQRLVVIFMVLCLYIVLFFLPFGDRREWGTLPEIQVLRWIGAALAGIGYALIFWSGLALGRQYSRDVTIQKDHKLIVSGPYQWIRHPRYLGVLAAAIGLALLFRSIVGLLVFPVLLGILLFRIRDEEMLMGKEFGEEWSAYIKHSWRLLPFVF